jgi:hypothetical protein
MILRSARGDTGTEHAKAYETNKLYSTVRSSELTNIKKHVVNVRRKEQYMKIQQH